MRTAEVHSIHVGALEAATAEMQQLVCVLLAASRAVPIGPTVPFHDFLFTVRGLGGPWVLGCPYMTSCSRLGG